MIVHVKLFRVSIKTLKFSSLFLLLNLFLLQTVHAWEKIEIEYTNRVKKYINCEIEKILIEKFVLATRGCDESQARVLEQDFNVFLDVIFKKRKVTIQQIESAKESFRQKHPCIDIDSIYLLFKIKVTNKR